MELLKTAPRPSTRLNRGNLLLANAQMVDTAPVQARFEAFVEMHRRYIEAHVQVEAAVELERAELRQVAQLDGAQERALTGLSAALQVDGEPRRNPFGRFFEHAPGAISAMPYADKVKAVRAVVSALRRRPRLSGPTQVAAARLEQAAVEVDAALAGWALRRTYLAAMRQQRNALAVQWDTAYRALRHLSQSMVEDGDFYASLFAQPRRVAQRTRSAAPADQSSRGAAADELAPAAPSDDSSRVLPTTEIVSTAADNQGDLASVAPGNQGADAAVPPADQSELATAGHLRLVATACQPPPGSRQAA